MKREIIDQETVEMFEMTNRHSAEARKQRLSRVERANKKKQEEVKLRKSEKQMVGAMALVIILSVVAITLGIRTASKDYNKCIEAGNSATYCQASTAIG